MGESPIDVRDANLKLSILLHALLPCSCRGMCSCRSPGAQALLCAAHSLKHELTERERRRLCCAWPRACQRNARSPCTTYFFVRLYVLWRQAPLLRQSSIKSTGCCFAHKSIPALDEHVDPFTSAQGGTEQHPANTAGHDATRGCSSNHRWLPKPKGRVPLPSSVLQHLLLSQLGEGSLDSQRAAVPPAHAMSLVCFSTGRAAAVEAGAAERLHTATAGSALLCWWLACRAGLVQPHL